MLKPSKCNAAALAAVNVALLAFSCNAPRHNPLDPQNSNYSYAALEGNLQTVSLPRLPISEATVLWRPENRMTQTDAAGYFLLDPIAPINGWVYFEKSGYQQDSFYVAWNQSRHASVARFLNASPQLQELSLTSVVINNHLSGGTVQTQQLELKAWITDQDNDIDSVFAVCPALSIQSLLNDIVDKRYVKTIRLGELKINDLEEAVGREFEIQVKDNSSTVHPVGRGSLKRVIKEEILFDSPANHQGVTATPTLRWSRFAPGFSFTLIVEIYPEEINPQVVYRSTGLGATQVSHTVEQALPPGDYFWVIWCVDEFGNLSRSKPASFTVLQ